MRTMTMRLSKLKIKTTALNLWDRINDKTIEMDNIDIIISCFAPAITYDDRNLIKMEVEVLIDGGSE